MEQILHICGISRRVLQNLKASLISDCWQLAKTHEYTLESRVKRIL